MGFTIIRTCYPCGFFTNCEMQDNSGNPSSCKGSNMKTIPPAPEKPAISASLACELEEVEKNAWSDMYQAAPADFAQDWQLFLQTSGSMTLISAALPTGLFNKVFMHGLTEELTGAQIREIMDFYSSRGAWQYYVYTTPFSKPAPAEQLLLSHGLAETNATDKVYCEPGKITLPTDEPVGFTVRMVDHDKAAEWAGFICATYGGLPNQPWLVALVNREGWYHAIAEQEGKIIACRSMFIDPQNRAWLGIDAPIPGMMTAFYEPDYFIIKKLLAIAKGHSVHLVNSCVECIDETRETAAYRYYYQLGFRIAYLRRNFGLPK